MCIGEREEDNVQLSALSGINSAVENHFGQGSLFNEYSIKGHKGLPVLLQLGTVLIIHLTLGLPAELIKAIVGHTMLLDFSLNH